MNLVINRNTAPIATVSIDEQTIFSWEMMGMDATDTELSRK